MAGRLRRRQLSREAVLNAALIVARRDGIDFTMRALGEELNAWQNVAYDHFPSKRALQYEILDQILDEALDTKTLAHVQDRSRDWSIRLRTFCLHMFGHLAAYRGAGRFVTHHGAAGPPNVVRFVSVSIGLFQEGGMSLDRAIEVFQAVTFFVAESADLEAATRQGLTTNDVLAHLDEPLDPSFREIMCGLLNKTARDRVKVGLDLFIRSIEMELRQ